MKTKQIISLVVAVALFVLTGVVSVMSWRGVNEYNASRTIDLLAQITEGKLTLPSGKYMAMIAIHGTIQPSTTADYLSGGAAYDHNYYLDLVDILMTDDNCQGIILDVDSPGGTVYETDELYLKLMEFKAVTEKPIYAYFRSYACSGAYYLAMAADEIYANRNTTTGSIGVIITTYNYSELLDKIGVDSISIASGPNKTIGSPEEPMTEEQKAIYQAIVDESYSQFVNIIAAGRGMDEATVRAIGDGRIYTATQALNLNMIDGICTADEFYASMNEIADVADLNNYASNPLLSFLGLASETLTPKSESQYTLEWIKSLESGVPMYVYLRQ